MKTCNDCKFLRKIDVKEHGQIGQDIHQCFRYPPNSHLIGSGQGIAVMNTRPALAPSEPACGEYYPVKEIEPLHLPPRSISG